MSEKPNKSKELIQTVIEMFRGYFDWVENQDFPTEIEKHRQKAGIEIDESSRSAIIEMLNTKFGVVVDEEITNIHLFTELICAVLTQYIDSSYIRELGPEEAISFIEGEHTLYEFLEAIPNTLPPLLFLNTEHPDLHSLQIDIHPRMERTDKIPEYLKRNPFYLLDDSQEIYVSGVRLPLAVSMFISALMRIGKQYMYISSQSGSRVESSIGDPVNYAVMMNNGQTLQLELSKLLGVMRWYSVMLELYIKVEMNKGVELLESAFARTYLIYDGMLSYVFQILANKVNLPREELVKAINSYYGLELLEPGQQLLYSNPDQAKALARLYGIEAYVEE